MAFIDAHATEIAAAVLTAPSFLSGLSPAELNDVRHSLEMQTNPEVAKAKADTMQALADAESGWMAAARQISARGGLTQVGNGQT